MELIRIPVKQAKPASSLVSRIQRYQAPSERSLSVLRKWVDMYHWRGGQD
jgi:hypothetical protein